MGATGMMGGGFELGPRTTGSGYREECRRHIESGTRDRVQGQLGRGGKAARRRNGPGPPQRRPPDIRQTIVKTRDQLRRGVIAVVSLVQPEVLHSKIRREIDD